jgi:uncharacterized protein
MVVECPQCGKKVVWDSKNPYRPFCSERCKQMDLGAWAQEKYVIPGASSEPDTPQDEER